MPDYIKRFTKSVSEPSGGVNPPFKGGYKKPKRLVDYMGESDALNPPVEDKTKWGYSSKIRPFQKKK